MDMRSESLRLQRIHAALSADRRQSLLDFAEYLLMRSGAELPTSESLPELEVLSDPLFEEAPDDETVTGALTRLSRVYAMLDTEALVAQASLAVLEGSAMREKSARQLIDELERFFAERYQRARLVC